MISRIQRLFILLLSCAVFAACSSTTVVVAPKHVPPGQAKKVTGTNSAKSFAPGQQKKKR